VWAAAAALQEPPHAPYWEVYRGRPWEDPLQDAESEPARALQRLLSGEEDAEREALRQRAAADRAAESPRLEISDEELTLLAEATIVSRLTRDSTSGAMLLGDSMGGFHWFDGYDVVPAPFETIPLLKTLEENRAAFFGDAQEVSERHLTWSATANEFEEWTRFGDRILALAGVNNGYMNRRVGLCFSSEDEAQAFLETVRTNPPEGYMASEPYYFSGHGAVARTWYRGSDRLLDGAIGPRTLSGREFDSLEAATAWLDAYDLETWRTPGGRVTRLEWLEGRLREGDVLTAKGDE